MDLTFVDSAFNDTISPDDFTITQLGAIHALVDHLTLHAERRHRMATRKYKRDIANCRNASAARILRVECELDSLKKRHEFQKKCFRDSVQKLHDTIDYLPLESEISKVSS